jgi:hypothetical protein
MWDHVVFFVGYRVNVETVGSPINSTYASSAEEAYAQRQQGILTNDMSDYLDSAHRLVRRCVESTVKGVRGLRAVDASSFPILMPGHP